MKGLRALYFRSWRNIVLLISLGIIAYLLYWHRLHTLLPGYSKPEVAALAASGDWHTIVANPVNAPYKILVWLCLVLFGHNALTGRAVAAAFGILFTGLFFTVVRSWCSYRVAYVATVLFAASGGLLHFARFGTGYILQMSVLALLAVVLWYRKERRFRAYIGYLLVLLLVLLWYVPGMIWFELLGLVPLWPTIRGQIRRSRTVHATGLAVLFVLAATPIAWACVKHPGILLSLSGLPGSTDQLQNTAHNLYRLLAGIGIYSNGNPLFWVGNAPLLDGVAIVAALLGTYRVYREDSLARSTFMFGSLAIGLALASFGNTVTFACLVPILYLFVAIGLDYFLDLWLRVFPRNPIARYSGVAVVLVLAAFSVFYQLRAYYVAWPNAPATRAVFDQKA